MLRIFGSQGKQITGRWGKMDEQSIICIASVYYDDNQIKDDDIGRTHSMLGKLGMHPKSEGKRPLSRPICGRTISKHILRNMAKVCTGFISSTLKMEASSSSKILASIYQTSRYNIKEYEVWDYFTKELR